MASIWVISEVPDRVWEMLSQAKLLAGQLDSPVNSDVTAFIAGDEATGNEAFTYGADHVKLIPMPDKTIWENYASIIAQEAAQDAPQVILVSATRRGKGLAAQLAVFLNCPCVSDCQSISIADDKSITMQRLVYGGLAVNTIKTQALPLIITIAAKTFEKPDAEPSRTGTAATLDLAGDFTTKVVERKPKDSSAVNINDADIVVGVGRGFKSADEVSIAEELAQAMRGEVACSRPIAEQEKWLPEDRYVGISGQVIKPSLYLAAGISGQVQHVYGIRDAKTIVAVNNDENAPILQVADYYIVGDIKTVLPAITNAVKEISS
jgi:electron transfer flavoprotein alpha subunit